MAFKLILNELHEETLWTDFIAREVQLHYHKLKEHCYYLKLEKSSKNSTKIIWVKTFNNIEELTDYYFEFKFGHTCILIRFRKTHYDIFYRGYRFSHRFEVHEHKVVRGMPIEISWDVEATVQLPRDLLFKGFGEISSLAKESFRKKYV